MKHDPFSGIQPTSITQLQSACRALPDLDLLVLLTDIPIAKPLAWDTGVKQGYFVAHPHAQPSYVTFTTYYFYPCASLRAAAPQH